MNHKKKFFLFKQSTHFCSVPWNHFEVFSNGDIKTCSKGNPLGNINKSTIEEILNGTKLHEIKKDLLNDKHYTNYNLSIHEGISNFLENFLSLVLVPESCIGEQIELDIGNYFENKKTMDYYYNTINSDSSMFNTSI